MYNFDEIIDRKTSGCVKFDALDGLFGREDIIPLWIADMDFKAPDFLLNAFRERIEHPVFGYNSIPEDYFSTISEWMKNIHGRGPEPSHIKYIPGVMKGVAYAFRAFLKPGDKVVIQPPVYFPFKDTILQCGLEVVNNPLLPVYEDGIGKQEDSCGKDRDKVLKGYRMDLEGLESLIDERTKMILIANPHNPGGVCWDKETLCKLASIASAHGLIVISDEIHSEIVLPGKCHHPFASVSREAADNSISFFAPSKTFNIAGIVSSYCVIENPDLRKKYFSWLEAGELDSPSIFSVLATEAVYKEGAQWRKEMIEYVTANINFVKRYLESEMPKTASGVPVVRALEPQASFLIWLDCRSLGLSQPELVDLFVNGAGLGLNDGSMFGKEGTGFMRLNVGAPRSILKEALDRLSKAVNSRF